MSRIRKAILPVLNGWEIGKGVKVHVSVNVERPKTDALFTARLAACLGARCCGLGHHIRESSGAGKLRHRSTRTIETRSSSRTPLPVVAKAALRGAHLRNGHQWQVVASCPDTPQRSCDLIGRISRVYRAAWWFESTQLHWLANRGWICRGGRDYACGTRGGMTMHHSDRPPDAVQGFAAQMEEIRRKQQLRDMEDSVKEAEQSLGLGATGQFPGGKLTEEDEGEIKIAVTHKDGKVVLAFGKPVSWVGFMPQEARAVAETLRKHSHEVDKEQRGS